jgi:molybdate transport repressor ModE-like protein
MNKIDIKPAWLFTDAAGKRLGPELFDVLRAIRETGSVQRAARMTGYSYRHLWNQTAKWSRFFSGPLIELRRGRGAKLTALGEKLLWAEQRIEASLSSHLNNLAADLERDINEALASARPVIYTHASHDLVLGRVRDLFNQENPSKLDLHFCGSLDALASLCRGTCDIAGFHLPSGMAGMGLLKKYSRFLKPRVQKLVHFATRCQGIMVAPSNPHVIQRLADLTRREVRFVNRQPGSGTRLLLDELLGHHGIDSARISGYEVEEFTHAAVAATVASGLADAGFGIKAAAHQFGLQFIPIINERYFLTCHQDMLSRPETNALLDMLRGGGFKALIAQYPGYDGTHSGDVVSVGEAFPELEKTSRHAGPRSRP